MKEREGEIKGEIEVLGEWGHFQGKLMLHIDNTVFSIKCTFCRISTPPLSYPLSWTGLWISIDLWNCRTSNLMSFVLNISIYMLIYLLWKLINKRFKYWRLRKERENNINYLNCLKEIPLKNSKLWGNNYEEKSA